MTQAMMMKIDAWYRANASRYDAPTTKIPLLPFADEKYFEPGPLKIMHLGINAYVRDGDWDMAQETWWRDWARTDAHKFHKWMSTTQLAFKDFPTASYRTNLVKIFLPEDSGKSANAIHQSILKKSHELLFEEFMLLDELKALPNIILCYGRKSWDGVWPIMFRDPRTKDIDQHQAFRAFFDRQEMLVFQLTHPSAIHWNKEDAIDASKILMRYGEMIRLLKMTND